MAYELEWFGCIDSLSSNYFDMNEDDRDNDKKRFVNRCRTKLLGMIYEKPNDNSTISDTNHGNMKNPVVNIDNEKVFKGFFYGLCCRIEENIKGFFQTTSIESSDTMKQSQETYCSSWQHFFNDNSLGNKMLLQSGINRAAAYSNKVFSEKREYVIGEDYITKNNPNRLFFPIGTMNVFMGKFLEMGKTTHQWLMGERYRYIKDIISVLENYFDSSGTDEMKSIGEEKSDE